MLDQKKRTWAEINVHALRHNYENIVKSLPEGCGLMGVVKANAYGHGAVNMSKMLQRFGCHYLAVACIDEAEELREAGIELPILILGATPPEFTERLLAADVAQTLSSYEWAKAYSKKAEKLGKILRVHLKLETGMGRTGFNVKDGDVSEPVKALAFSALEAEGVYTHFAVSDEAEGEEYTRAQYTSFTEAISKIEEESGLNFKIRHCANSGVLYNYPEMYMDMVRPGIALYGAYAGKAAIEISASPIMSLRSRIVQINNVKKGESISYGGTFTAERDMTLAVVPVGYADGLHRVLSDKIDMLVNNKRCRQIGRICMDMCMLDVSDAGKVKVGDIATVFGHDTRGAISVNELARRAGTISYEILTSVSERVPRNYV